jgi:hypothetical protein
MNLNFNNMNKKKLIVLGSLVLSLFVFSSFKGDDNLRDIIASETNYYQKGLIVYATYIGADDTGYTFEKKAKNGKMVSFTFHEIKPAVLKKFDLKSEVLKGTHFKITFDKDDKFTENTSDDTNVIIDLEKY